MFSAPITGFKLNVYAFPSPSTQPANVCPSFSGFVGLTQLSPQFFLISSTMLPPSVSNVIVYWFISHSATNTIFSAPITGSASNLQSSPFNFQPTNVQPTLLGSSGASYLVPQFTLISSTALPPWTSNLILYWFILHCAYNTISPSASALNFDTLVPATYPVPLPSSSVFHPKNVYPSLEVVPISQLSSYLNSLSSTAVPSPSYTIVYLFSDHAAYNSTSSAGIVVCSNASPFSYFQPKNVQPTLLIDGNSTNAPYLYVASTTVVPPFSTYVILYEFTNHCAFNVMFSAGIVPNVYSLPSPSYHPLNVCPSFLGSVGSLTLAL